MGTARDAGGKLVSAGGRVIMVTESAPTLAEARTKALKETKKIHEASPGLFHRSDIGAAEA